MTSVRDAESAISKALQIRKQKLGLTASFKTDRRVFADNRQLTKIDTPDWQIVFGRRGAGKTMLLATYANYITSTNSKKSASIEINAPEFTSIIESSGKKIKDSEVAQIFFADFMRLISDHLFKVFTTGNEESKFWRFYEISKKRRYIDDLVTEIKSSTMSAVPSAIGGRTRTTRKRKEESTRKDEAKVNLFAGLDASSDGVKAELKAGGGFDAEDLWQEKLTTEEIIGLNNYKFDYAKTRRLIEELLDALGFEKLYIFIDEWSELDRTASTNIQPYFAELLKRVFWKNPKFVIKIGAIRNQTRLLGSGENGSFGLEIAADIFEISLDSAYSDGEIKKVRFFEELVFRHLCFCNAELIYFQTHVEETAYGTIVGRPIDTFITFIFKSHEVFATLITGAGGLPRDFIEMFDAIAEAKRFSVESRWNVKDVKSAIWEHYIKNKHSTLEESEGLQDLCTKIMVLVKRNDSRLFLVRKSSKKEDLNSIAMLYHRRLIHDVAIADIPPLLRSYFHFFYADLGLHYDVSKEVYERQTVHDEICPLNGDEGPSDVERYILR